MAKKKTTRKPKAEKIKGEPPKYQPRRNFGRTTIGWGIDPKKYDEARKPKSKRAKKNKTNLNEDRYRRGLASVDSRASDI